MGSWDLAEFDRMNLYICSDEVLYEPSPIQFPRDIASASSSKLTMHQNSSDGLGVPHKLLSLQMEF